MNSGIGDFIKIQVGWRDTTRHGSTLSGRIQKNIQQVLHPESFTLVKNWMEGTCNINASSLTTTLFNERMSSRYQQLLQDPEFLHPPVEQTFPDNLYLRDSRNQIRAIIPLTGTNPQQLTKALREGEADIPLTLASVLHHAAKQQGTISRPKAIAQSPTVIVGHATISLFHCGIRLWLDPFFLPKRAVYGEWQPLSPLDLPAEQHCVLFTHSHPDHFDPASLLLFPSDTLFFAPPCPDGESLLTLDIAFRLRQLGFTHIQTLAWWENTKLGDFSITALPFYGEQAVGYAAEEPLLWNHGSTWHIRRQQDGEVFLFLADSGSDPRSYVTQFARQVRQQLGEVDYLFGNCRRWRLYPAQYITSSVPQYLTVTPDNELDRPQTIMMEAHELAAFAEICKVRQVFPYAMGGTPWFSELGLGYAHENHLATDFDTDPREALQGSRVLLRLPPSFQQMDANAGSNITSNGEMLPPPNYPIPYFSNNHESKDYVLTLSGNSITCGSTTANELAELSALVTQGTFVIAEHFCEFWLSSDDLFVQKLLDSWLEHFEGSYSIGIIPQSIGLFADNPTWRNLAKQLLRAAQLSLLNNDSQTALRRVLQTPPFNTLPLKLLFTVYHELTGNCPMINYQSNYLPIDLTLPDIDLPVAALQSPLYGQYPNTYIALALLICKCLHNNWLTYKILGKTTATEATFVEQLFTVEMT